MSSQTYTKKTSIPFQDVDAAGVVFFAHLFRYAHETYERFMDTVGHPLYQYIEQGDLILPLKHAEADYEHPLRYGDELEIILVVKNLGDSSFTLSYTCMNGKGERCAVVETVHVAVNFEKNKSVLIPEDLRKALSAYN